MAKPCNTSCSWQHRDGYNDLSNFYSYCDEAETGSSYTRHTIGVNVLDMA